MQKVTCFHVRKGLQGVEQKIIVLALVSCLCFYKKNFLGNLSHLCSSWTGRTFEQVEWGQTLPLCAGSGEVTPRAASHSSAGQTSPGPATSCFCPGPRWKTQDPAQLSLFSKACLDRHHRSAARWGRQRVPAVCFWGFPGYPKATFTLSLNTFNFFPRRLG